MPLEELLLGDCQVLIGLMGDTGMHGLDIDLQFGVVHQLHGGKVAGIQGAVKDVFSKLDSHTILFNGSMLDLR